MTAISSTPPPGVGPDEAAQFTRDYERVGRLVAEEGWAMVSVRHPGARPDRQVVWTYTVGLTARGKPEMFVQAPTTDSGRAMIGVLAGLALKEDMPLREGDVVRLPGLVPLTARYHTDLSPFPFAARRYTFIRMVELVPVRPVSG